MDENGRMVCDHGEKCFIFWNEFKRTLGNSVETSMQFILQDIVQQHSNLDHLCRSFTFEEIDNVILNLSYDKAPGPDGFNNLFLKDLGLSSRMTSTGYVLISIIIKLTSVA